MAEHNNFVREWRLYRGRQQKAVARAAGISVGTLYNLEKGRPTSTDVLRRVSDALDTSVAALLSVDPTVAQSETASNLRMVASIINGLADLVEHHPDRLALVARAVKEISVIPR